MSPEALYHQLGQLIASMPDLNADPSSAETQRWLGRAYALVEQGGRMEEGILFKMQLGNLLSGARSTAAVEISATLYRALALAELQVPASTQGTFIPAGNPFDAMAAVARVLGAAKSDVLIIDPYLDQRALTEFVSAAPELVLVRLLADQKRIEPSLQPAVRRWTEQYAGVRPLTARAAPPKSLHDRLIIVDGSDAWILTQSLKDLAVRSPATLIQSDPESSALKAEAYNLLWDQSTPLT